jgi:hypothetical protein
LRGVFLIDTRESTRLNDGFFRNDIHLITSGIDLVTCDVWKYYHEAKNIDDGMMCMIYYKDIEAADDF